VIRPEIQPVYDALMALVMSLGSDVRAQTEEAVVRLYRNRVFAQIKPVTRKRIDLGFALGLRRAQGKLCDVGGFAKRDRITHRIAIGCLADIDDEVKRWLRVAYDEDAE
jgi:hypothetical protein